jgi:hypothetical protein
VTRPAGETRTLLVELTPEQLQEAGEKLARAVAEEDELRSLLEDWLAEMKDARKARTEEIKAMHRDVAHLAQVVETGAEEREVYCSWLYALAEGYAFLVRDDTGEMLTYRQLDDEERQESLVEVLREPTPEQLGKWRASILIDATDELMAATEKPEEVAVEVPPPAVAERHSRALGEL